MEFEDGKEGMAIYIPKKPDWNNDLRVPWWTTAMDGIVGEAFEILSLSETIGTSAEGIKAKVFYVKSRRIHGLWSLHPSWCIPLDEAKIPTDRMKQLEFTWLIPLQ
jgi:hypothetical protein